MAAVYILYSESIDKYYVGSCLDLEQRLLEHRSKKYKHSFTAKTEDWTIFFYIENLDYKKARLIENHIKKMKNRKYFENLKSFKDVSDRLIKRFS